jgi:hypothetical protein
LSITGNPLIRLCSMVRMAWSIVAFGSTDTTGEVITSFACMMFAPSTLCKPAPKMVPMPPMRIDPDQTPPWSHLASVVTYIQAAPLTLDRIMLCWDGSRSAARAVGDAVPFLLQSKATEIVMVSGEPAKSDELPGPILATISLATGSRPRSR